MEATRMTNFMKRSLEARASELNARIKSLEDQWEGDSPAETTAMLAELSRERDGIVEALRDARLIDDDPFDTEAIEVGDVVTIRAADGEPERYVLVDGNAGSRARSDWVSVASPLGAALLGRNSGDVVRVESPSGAAEYQVLAFERASGDVPARLPSEAFLG
ncbi:MAG TPA: GreA/GreB family elongation factor [Actinomycetota bacterium]|nr:GreA/GreB family elongation factor [Actinomycetota bacterium]